MLVKFSEVVAFIFQGDLLCMSCVKDLAEGATLDLGAMPIHDADVHELISVWAARRLVPAYATREFYCYDTDVIDSNDIPMPLTETTEEARCQNCGRFIHETL